MLGDLGCRLFLENTVGSGLGREEGMRDTKAWGMMVYGARVVVITSITSPKDLSLDAWRRTHR